MLSGDDISQTAPPVASYKQNSNRDRTASHNRIYNATFFASITEKRDPLCVFLPLRYAQKDLSRLSRA